MEKDFIIVRKSLKDNYDIAIYFASINSTINIHLKESDFIKFLIEAIQLINDNSTKFILRIPDDIAPILDEKGFVDLVNISKKTADQKQKIKEEAEVIIYIKDYYVPLQLAENITNATGNFMESLGFELENEDEPVFSSFFKRLKFIFFQTIGNENIEELYSKGKKALELKHVDLPTAEQTEKLASAAEKLVNSLSEAKEGIIRCGALIVIKKTINGETKIIIQQLTSDLILLLDKKPHLIKSLSTMYELLKPYNNDELNNDKEDEALTA